MWTRGHRLHHCHTALTFHFHINHQRSSIFLYFSIFHTCPVTATTLLIAFVSFVRKLYNSPASTLPVLARDMMTTSSGHYQIVSLGKNIWVCLWKYLSVLVCCVVKLDWSSSWWTWDGGAWWCGVSAGLRQIWYIVWSGTSALHCVMWCRGILHSSACGDQWRKSYCQVIIL